MLKAHVWNVHDIDGHYIGPAKTFAAKTAFYECMSVTGIKIAEDDVYFEPADNFSGRISYLSEHFVLTRYEPISL